MKVAFFSAKPYDIRYFDASDTELHELTYFKARLEAATVSLAQGFDAVCVFVNDRINATVIDHLQQYGVKVIALRCVGFNNVDLQAADAAGICVVRVPEYSPAAVAEHTVALMLTLSRHLHKAYSRVRDGNFTLRGLEGFTFSGRTAGIIGPGRIGCCVAKILLGMGMRVRAYDPVPNNDLIKLGVDYQSIDVVLSDSDVITLHCPLTHETHHLINAQKIELLKPGVMLINTSRGAVIDTTALIQALKREHVGYVGLDVYEQEGDLFFRDLSDQIIQDDVFQRLLTFPNVIVTGHLGFFTTEALTEITRVTLANLDQWERGQSCANQIIASDMLAT